MSGIPTFQQLMDDENKEKDELGSNMQIKAPSGGKRRRTRTKKRRVKKTKRKTRTRKYKRRSTKKRRSIKRRRKTKNHRRQRGGDPVPRKYEEKKVHFFEKLNEERLGNNKEPVPREHVDNYVEEKRKEVAKSKYLDKASSMLKADPTGNTKATFTSGLAAVGIDFTGHNRRAADRKEVLDYANRLGLSPDTPKNEKLKKVAAAQAREEVGLNMHRFVGEAATQYDLMKKKEARLEQADDQIKGEREAQKIDEEKKDAELRQAKNQADAVNPGDRLVKAYGKGGRRRKRSTSRIRHKKRSGRRNRSRKV